MAAKMFFGVLFTLLLLLLDGADAWSFTLYNTDKCNESPFSGNYTAYSGNSKTICIQAGTAITDASGSCSFVTNGGTNTEDFHSCNNILDPADVSFSVGPETKCYWGADCYNLGENEKTGEDGKCYERGEGLENSDGIWFFCGNADDPEMNEKALHLEPF